VGAGREGRPLPTDLVQLWARIAHKMRSPLTSISTAGQLLQARFADDPANAEMAEIVVSESERLDIIIERLDGLFRPASLRPAPVDVAERLDGVLTLLDDAVPDGVRVTRDYAEPAVTVEADLEKVDQILTELVRNALEAMEGEGTLALAVAGSPDGVRATVADSGPGIPEGEREEVFTPLWTSRPGHLGVGLPFAQRLAALHGGALSLRPNTPHGTVAELFLPAE
jgi:signal transduction histidine kinase